MLELLLAMTKRLKNLSRDDLEFAQGQILDPSGSVKGLIINHCEFVARALRDLATVSTAEYEKAVKIKEELDPIFPALKAWDFSHESVARLLADNEESRYRSAWIQQYVKSQPLRKQAADSMRPFLDSGTLDFLKIAPVDVDVIMHENPEQFSHTNISALGVSLSTVMLVHALTCATAGGCTAKSLNRLLTFCERDLATSKVKPDARLQSRVDDTLAIAFDDATSGWSDSAVTSSTTSTRPVFKRPAARPTQSPGRLHSQC